MDLDSIAGPSWAGWRFHNELLFAPEWRQGLHPGEIRAIPYLCAIEADSRRKDRQLEDLRGQLAATARLAGWYRRQLVLESKFGLMLTRP